MDVNLLKTQWDAFLSNPVPMTIFIVIAASATWWLRSHIGKERIEALKAKNDVLEERLRLAADKGQPLREQALETDDKGNVKPPEKPSAPETPPDEPHAERNEFSLLLKMELAYLEEGDCLSKVTAYYDELKSIVGGSIHPQQIEAEYLLSRFRCGASSALDTLKAQSGATVESFFANAVLAQYYQSISETQAALQYFQYRFDHAPDSTRKLNSAISLGEFRAEIGDVAGAISFLKGQISYFQAPDDQAALWHAIGRIYESQGLHWQKQLCFEQSLKFNPDNTALRFSLAYSYGDRGYGKAMALHHYDILLQQTPRNSTVANNLSVIYDEVGAVATKISLLRGAQRRKDSAYVSANLATAYAKAGFIADARNCLEQVSVGEQQESIVQEAYRTIKAQTENDRQITEKLDRLAKMQQSLVGMDALAALNTTDEELVQRFVGEWQLEESTVVQITMEAGKLSVTICTENSYYEDARYQVTTEYEPGLLQLDAQLEEASLKERPTPKRVPGQLVNPLLGGFAGVGGGLGDAALLRVFNRPDDRFKLILVPGGSNILYGLRSKLTRQKSEGILTTGQREEGSQTLLNAKEVQLTNRVA